MIRALMQVTRMATRVSVAQLAIPCVSASNVRSLSSIACFRHALVSSKLYSTAGARAMQNRTVFSPQRVSAYQYQNDAGAPMSIQEVDFEPTLANNVSLIGTLGRRPEIRYFEQGKKVASSSLALKANKDAETQWVDVEAWDALAELFSSQVDKGSRVAVEGRLRIQEWTDRQGQPRKTVKIVASNIRKVRSNGMGVGGGSAMYNQEPMQQQQQPAAQSVYAQQSYAAPAGNAQQQPQLTTTEELWMSLFEDPHAWYDNRDAKAKNEINPKSPDFKKKEGGRESPALWVESTTTPRWVKDELPKLGGSAHTGEEFPPF